eukprot:TRINITY_DN3107_c0_g1_i2.p1 TRINITY_DN3107_c0_g1~~TRINITY_DN3107_c0_g1_i2.p1  ORF type:complete len:528 (-),score=49.53 TRINITY_DN3107_c0_g1_i2:1052-2635(-)
MQNNLGGLDPTGARTFQFPGVNSQQSNQGFGMGAGGMQLPNNISLTQRRPGLGLPNAGTAQAATNQAQLAGRLGGISGIGQVHPNLLAGNRLGDNQVYNPNLNLGMMQQQQQRLGSGLGQPNLTNITNQNLSTLNRTGSNVGSGLNIQGLPQTRNLQNQGVNLSNMSGLSSQGRGGLGMMQQQLHLNNPSAIMDFIRNNQQMNQQINLNQRLNAQVSQLPSGVSAGTGIQPSPFIGGLRKEGDEFSIQNEDFPALSSAGRSLDPVSRGLGSLGAGVIGQSDTNVLDNKTVNSGLLDSAVQQLQSQQQQIQQAAKVSSVLAATNNGSSDLMAPGLQQNAANSVQKEESPDRFGLMGLLHVIRMVDQDLTTLALGSNLTDLGLNLNSQDKLYKSFASPWSDAPLSQKPNFKVPSCFYFKPQRVYSGFFHKVQEKTLLYAFYSMPGEEAQIVAAEALSNLGWMYHKERKQWIKRVKEGGHVKQAQYEKGNYLAFDFENWHLVRLEGFTLFYDQIEETPQPMRKPVIPQGQ